MGDLSLLQLSMLVLIIAELSLFLIMNGSDFGVGMSTIFMANDAGKSELLRVPGSVWFGNETWFVVGMATIFAMFPRWYASLASGYYLAFIFILILFIFRAVGFDYRTRWTKNASNKLMDILLFLGSLIPPFLVAMIFASALQGVPISNEVVYAGFFDIVTPFTVWSGITMVLMCWSVGLSRVIKFVEGELKEYLRKKARVILYALFVALVVEVVFLLGFTTVLHTNPIPIIFLISIIVVGVVMALFLSARHIDRLYFWATTVPIVAFMAILFIGLFPNAIIDTGGNSLSLIAAASAYESQLWVAAGSAFMLPLMIMGQILLYYYLNKLYRVPDTDINL